MSHTHQLFLDHASTTPVHPDVLGLMLPYFGYHFGSTGSFYELAQRSKVAVEEARSRVARLIGADPREIVFTSSGTESDNMAILGAAQAHRSRGNHIITSAVEHPAVLHACRHLEHQGFRVTCLPVDKDGLIDPALVEDAINDDTILISIMHANNEVGTIEPIAEIGKIAREKGITFHSDAVQSAGKIAIDVAELNVDLLSIASHKLYGPKGVGALYIRTKTKIAPLLFGSGQEQGLRPGTLNIPGVVGFGMACEVACRDLENNRVQMTALRESLEQQVLQRIPGTSVHGAGAPRLPHISSIAFEGLLADSIGASLDAKDISVSTGSAPTLYGKHVSHVLAAMNVSPELANATVRFSLGWENKEREVRKTLDCLEDSVTRLRDFSKASRSKEVSIFTFPDKAHAVSAHNLLKDRGIPYALTAKPEDIMQLLCAHIALACLSSDQHTIGALLGEHGIDITGTHRLQPQCRTATKKELEFWAKVAEIKKGKG